MHAANKQPVNPGWLLMISGTKFYDVQIISFTLSGDFERKFYLSISALNCAIAAARVAASSFR